MISFREDRGTYVVTVMYGVRRIRRQAKTIKEAEALERALLKEAPKDKGWSLPFACREYLRLKSPKKISGASERKFLSMLDIFLDLKGISYLCEIKPMHLEELQLWLMKRHEFNNDVYKTHEPIKPSSVNRYFSTYSSFFNWCASNGMVEKNPCEHVRALAIEKPEIVLITDFEFNEFLRQVPDWFRPVAKFIYYTGMRPSSVEKLQWKDIDLERSRIVYKTRKGSTGKEVEKLFPLLMTELIAVLNETRGYLIAKGILVSPQGYVFSNKNGTPISAERISKVANKHLKRMGLKCTLYSLRHRLVTDLIERGIGIELASQLVGHASIRTTQNYSQPQSMAVLNEGLKAVRSQVLGAQVAQREEGVS